ncbi:hypothetical protein B0A49_03348, partial [Cryomyces minteri]
MLQTNAHDVRIGDMGLLSAAEDGEETTFMSLNSPIMLRYPDSFVESAAENEDVVTQFLEQTFAMHDNLQSSQIVEAARPFAADDITGMTTSFLTTMTSESSFTSELSSPLGRLSQTQAKVITLSGRLTDISALPKADYLHKICPQTMTVDLVVGVISVAPARTVNVRKGGFEMDIVEMLVGDETKAGFSISFWLSPAE